MEFQWVKLQYGVPFAIVVDFQSTRFVKCASGCSKSCKVTETVYVIMCTQKNYLEIGLDFEFNVAMHNTRYDGTLS